MQRIQPGLIGWANKRRGIRRFPTIRWVGAVVIVVALAACSSSKPASQGAGPEGGGATGMGDQNLGAGGGSMEKFQHGTLGAGGSGGPLTDVHFDYDDYTIRPQDGEILRTNARWLTDHGGSHVQVEGHTDERGSEEYNLALGAKRAQAAKDYLTTLGVSGDRISTISYGKELPLCTEHTDDCYAENRRDHFVVSQAGQ
jgi:peptidoglycan-associated lipoprotein